jgi:hypothetical protein
MIHEVKKYRLKRDLEGKPTGERVYADVFQDGICYKVGGDGLVDLPHEEKNNLFVFKTDKRPEVKEPEAPGKANEKEMAAEVWKEAHDGKMTGFEMQWKKSHPEG